jgi:hypothetical protein
MMGEGMMGGGMMGGGMDHDHMQMMMQMMMMQMMMHHMQHMMDESGMMGGGMIGGGMMGGGMMGGGMMGGGAGAGENDGQQDSSPASGEHQNHQDGTPDAAPAAAAGEERSGKAGDIEVKATPVNLAARSGETLDFSVDLEAQGQPLDFDVAPLAKLMVGSEEFAAGGWKVNFDHGHHVNGTLSFDLSAVEPALAAGGKLMLHIGVPDGGEAMLSWDLPE